MNCTDRIVLTVNTYNHILDLWRKGVRYKVMQEETGISIPQIHLIVKSMKSTLGLKPNIDFRPAQNKYKPTKLYVKGDFFQILNR